MLEVLNVSQVIARPKQDALTVLNQVSFGVPKGHLLCRLPGSLKRIGVPLLQVSSARPVIGQKIQISDLSASE